MSRRGGWLGLFSRRRPGSIDVRTAEQLRGKGAILLDVREHDEWQAQHARFARHIPLDELPRRLGEVPAGTSVLTICQSGRRSARAAALLAREGHEVRSVHGGMIAWTAAGLPAVGPAGRTQRPR